MTRTSHRGLTLLELLLAMSISALVGLAIAGMLGAVSTGVGSRRDNRSTMVLANAAQTRLAAYIAPSRCVLSAASPDVVVWLNDARESGTVHASEVRWLVYDAVAGAIEVDYVDFPDAWSKAARDLADQEYTMAADWAAVRTSYASKGLIGTTALVDGLASASVITDALLAKNVRHLSWRLVLATDTAASASVVSSTVLDHQQPVK